MNDSPIPDNSVSACEHLVADPDDDYYRHFTGNGVESWFLCSKCIKAMREGKTLSMTPLTRKEALRLDGEGFLDGISGSVSITECSGPAPAVRTVALSGDAVTALAPLPDGRWLTYDTSRQLTVFDPDSGLYETIIHVSLPEEEDQEWCQHNLAPRLHADPTGRFAALVHDYGRYGAVIDLKAKCVSMKLDGGSYYPETVPFAACFIEYDGRSVLIHRTDWNRLDISDPETGRLLTGRGPTSYTSGEERPPHYLDYFHGGLHVSPSGTKVLDDGWVWQPMGCVSMFDARDWLSGNMWETEEACRKPALPLRDDWDIGICWIDDERFALQTLIPDSSCDDGRKPVGLAFIYHLSGEEIVPLAGPGGWFFSDGGRLFSSNMNGLSVWNIDTGCRSGFIPGFSPTVRHPDRRELAQVKEGELLFWCYDC